MLADNRRRVATARPLAVCSEVAPQKSRNRNAKNLSKLEQYDTLSFFLLTSICHSVILYEPNGCLMRIISEKKLREFWQAAKGGERTVREQAMREWIGTVRSADWRNFAELRQTFNHADVYCGCTIFDVGGNKYRIIAYVSYRRHIVYIWHVLTHAEYDKKNWQNDCE